MKARDNNSKATAQPKLLLLAYACDPFTSTECRVGWNRTIQAAKKYPIDVLCHCERSSEELKRLVDNLELPPHVQFFPLQHTKVESILSNIPFCFYIAYRMWHRRAYKIACRLHDENQYALAHQVNLCGYRQPGLLWKLEIPFVWGPWGGTQNYPASFLSEADVLGGAKEVLRSVANFFQLRFARRVRKAVKKAAVILVANSTAQKDLKKTHGLSAPIHLETGIENIRPCSPAYDGKRPLRILWSGRLATWKALPLLFKALVQLPSSVHFELRILGQGKCEARWKKLAKKMGLSDRIGWFYWNEFAETHTHYDWTDIFAFTSLRDTSGTGLMESLSTGTPIVGLDHQGAHDVMNDQCAIRIPVTEPKQTIAAFSAAIHRIADNPNLFQELRLGALEQAERFMWDAQGEEMIAVYDSVLNATAEIDSPQEQTVIHANTLHQKTPPVWK